MKAKVLTLLAVVCLLTSAAWFVQAQRGRVEIEIPEEYRDTARKGLDFLARHQFEDGHFEEAGGAHPGEMTGLVGIAFLMETGVRHNRTETPRARDKSAAHAANTRQAADWLIAKSQANRDGLIFSEHASETSRYMHGHGLATLFLAGVCENEREDGRKKELLQVLTRAIKYIAQSQSSEGGWYDTSKSEGHDFATIRATVIQLQALQAAENADVPVPPSVVKDAESYLRSALIKQEQQGPHEARIGPDDMSAILGGLRKNYVTNQNAPARKWLEECSSRIPVGRDIKFGRDEHAHYYLAQAQQCYSADAWIKYKEAMFEHLHNIQNKDGSWPADDNARLDRVHATAVWCTILALDNVHPSSRRFPVIVD
jgi:hypothetical protein